MLLLLFLLALCFMFTVVLFPRAYKVAVNHKRCVIKLRIAAACACNGREVERDLKVDSFTRVVGCIRSDRDLHSRTDARLRLVSVIASDRRSIQRYRTKVVTVNYISIISMESRRTHAMIRLFKTAIYSIRARFTKFIKLIYMKGDNYNADSQGR